MGYLFGKKNIPSSWITTCDVLGMPSTFLTALLGEKNLSQNWGMGLSRCSRSRNSLNKMTTFDHFDHCAAILPPPTPHVALPQLSWMPRETFLGLEFGPLTTTWQPYFLLSSELCIRSGSWGFQEPTVLFIGNSPAVQCGHS